MKKLALFFVALLLSPNISAAAQTPQVAAEAAVLMDYKTGRVLWEKNAKAPMAMASTTKIMTAIIALENADITETATVSRRAASAPPVKMYLTDGERIPLGGLLQALMLQSSNDAAVAIAEHVGGTVENFCELMTNKARELGAEDTAFVTPNGLDAGDHHSTAYDMALITRYALSNDAFVSLINTREATVKSSKRVYEITNKNRLLSEYDGANGVKTGYTGKAGQCFVGAAKRGGMQLITVVLASGWGAVGREKKWADTRKIMDYGFAAFEYTPIITEGDLAGSVRVERSKTAGLDAAYGQSVTLPLSEAERGQISVSPQLPEKINAPVTEGENLGVAYITIGDETAFRVMLTAQSSAARQDFKAYLETLIFDFMRLADENPPRITLPEF